MGYIYGIKNPIDGALLYVGQCLDFEKRKQQHLRKSHNEMLRNEIYSIQMQDAMPEFFIIEQSIDGKFTKSESRYIKELKPVCNSGNGCVCVSTKELKPTTLKNVTIIDAKFKQLEKADRLKYMSFSAYVNKLIDADLETSL